MKTVWDRHGQKDSRKLVSFLNQRDLVKRAFTSLSYCCFHHPGASIPHRGSLLRRGSHWMFQWSSTSTQSSRSLEQEGTDKYLEISEGDRVQHSLKEKIQKEYYPRIRMVLKSELNSPTKLEAINTLAVPVVTYSFNIIFWTLQELAELDTKTRNFLTMYKMHHPKSDVDRHRNEGGGGFIQLELSYKSTTIGLDKYFQEAQDTLLHFVEDHDYRKSLYSISR